MSDYLERLKKELEKELKKKEELNDQLNGQIAAVEKEIKRLQWRIEEESPTIMMKVSRRTIESYSDAWARIDYDETIEVTKKNAIQIVEELQKFADIVNHLPYSLTTTFSKEIDKEMCEIYSDIREIKKTFELDE